MDYYIQGDPTRAEEIKAAFEAKGFNTLGINFSNKALLYFSFEGHIKHCCNDWFFTHLIKTHPNYQELELPVEYKFKVGDWIVQNDNGTVSQITKTINGKDEYGEYSAYEHTNGYFAACFENEYHLWTIADAKDGDVLVTTKVRSCPFIYRKTSSNNGLAYYYAGIDGDGNFREGCIKRTLYHFGPVSDVAPATKEQRDLLFKKMKEAGYQWDVDKKELKKIPVKPKFKVGDSLQSGSYFTKILSINLEEGRYYCDNRIISFENQDLWHLVPKPHYNIANFHAGMPVLVRDSEEFKWLYTIFGIYNKDNLVYPFVVVDMRGYAQCIPFNEDTKHLLGTTDMCPEEYINW